jgi:Protein of unknown function (DUF4242)
MPYLLVEYQYDPPVKLEEKVADAQRLGPCLQQRNIRHMRSWLSQDCTWGVCEYEAADAESVREAYRSAQVKFARVRAADLLMGAS